MTTPANRLPPVFRGTLALPVIASPMFILSGPELVIAECLSGMVGAFPALNARAPDTLDGWLTRIKAELSAARAADPARKIAPFAVNQIVHASNDRLERDMETCVAHEVPLIITSLRAPGEVVRQAHSYGGVVFHDVTTVRHAEKALEAGASGIVVSNHGGRVLDHSPATAEVLPKIDDAVGGKMTILVDGGIRSGMDIFMALALGADAVLIGRPFVTAVYGGEEEGVQLYVQKLKAELADTMRMCGAHSLAEIKCSMLFGF